MTIKVFLTESSKTIEAKILKAIAQDMNQFFPKRQGLIENILSRIIYDSISTCPEMDSVSIGKLRIDFGLVYDPVAAIANAVAQSTRVVFKNFNTKLTAGGYQITVQPLDYLNLLSLPDAFQVTEKGVSLPWLEWLLTYGDSIIITNFGVDYKAGTGRTGGGFMNTANRPFSVDSFFSGTVDNNFVTRAIYNNIPIIETELIKALT